MATEEQLAELMGQLQLMTRRQADLEAALAQSLQQQAAAQRQTQQPVAPTAPGRQRRALVDLRGLGVPPQLEPDGKNWTVFQFRLENYMELLHRGARASLAWAAEQIDEVTEQDRDQELPLSVETLEFPVDLDEEVYGSLSALLSGEAADIIMSVSRGAGLEAWRRIARRHDGAGPARLHGTLSAMLNPERKPLRELSSYI